MWPYRSQCVGHHDRPVQFEPGEGHRRSSRAGWREDFNVVESPHAEPGVWRLQTIVAINAVGGQRKPRYQTFPRGFARVAVAQRRFSGTTVPRRVASPARTQASSRARRTGHASTAQGSAFTRSKRRQVTTPRRPSGGARAGRAAGTSVGNPRCRRIRTVTAPASIRARSRKRPPQRGHARTSMSNGAPHQVGPAPPGGTGRHPGVRLRGSIARSAAAAARATTSARHAARGPAPRNRAAG